MKRILLLTAALLAYQTAAADERLFTYSYEASVLPKGSFEVEQWVTNQSGKQDGHYSVWDYRTEVEYGVTERYMTALYFNWNYTHSEGVTGVESDEGADIKGFSWENIYQIMNPNIDPVGLAVYGEFSSDFDDYELEGKILLSKPLENGLNLVFNAAYEAEWEKEDEEEGVVTEHEAEVTLTSGVSYKLSPSWAAGVEARYVAAYPDGFDLQGREYQAVSVGPNLHYGAPHWWVTATVLPQIWGDGDGARGGRQLVHEEKLEFRVIFGWIF